MTDPQRDTESRSIELAGYLHDTAVQEGTAALVMLELVLTDPALPSSVQTNLTVAQEAVRASLEAVRAAMTRLDPGGLHRAPGPLR